jgi:hypothetical protein
MLRADSAGLALNGLVRDFIRDSVANFAVVSAVWDAWDDGLVGSAGLGDFGDWL